MLSLHAALVVSRIIYSYPYIILLPTACERVERLHRNGLRVALEVSQCARNICVYTEAQTSPLALIGMQCVLMQTLRLGETSAGCTLLARLRSRPISRLAISLATARFLGWQGGSPRNSHGPELLWSSKTVTLREYVPGIRRKSSQPPLVQQTAAAEIIRTIYPTPIRVYTDGSSNGARQSSIAAVHIPSLYCDWSGRMSGMVPSTTAELLAISKALLIITTIDPQPVVVLTDSRCAMRAICNPRENIIARAAGNVINILEDNGFEIILQ